MRDPEEHLAVHLATFYWRDKLDLSAGSLLSRFYVKASDE